MSKKPGEEGIRVVLADDHTLVRSGIRMILSATGKYTVVAEASNGEQAIEAVMEAQPDLLILDISMPLMNGTEIITQVKQRSKNTKVMIMTMHRGEQYVRMAMSGGADGYILKEDDRRELMFAIGHVLKGNTYISPTVSAKVIEGFLDSKETEQGILDKLTPRERQVMKLIAEGMTNREIAELLLVGVKTIDKHRASLMRKLSLKNAAAITAFAIECGVIRE